MGSNKVHGHGLQVVTDGSFYRCAVDHSVFYRKMNGGCVVLAVYGGKLSEGVEVRHPTTGRSRIQLLILIGMPFPVFTPEYNLLMKLYQKKWKNFQFAQWTILERLLNNKINQCIGRGIRSKQDQAAAVLLDDRAVKFLQLRLLGMRIYTSQRALADALTLALLRTKRIILLMLNI